MTTQPKDLMTLEEAATVLKAYKKHLDDCESYDSSMLSRGEKVRLAAITSALHHLEAGRGALERLESIHQLAVYPSDCATDLIGDPDAESKLRSRIADLSFINPTTPTAQEVNG